MASSLYYPTKAAPSTTLTITGLESRPASRPREDMRGMRVTPGGTAIIDNLGPTVQWLELKINLLSAADKTGLVDFIENTVGWNDDTFEFDDGKGVSYQSVRFWFTEHDFQETTLDRFEEVLLLRIDP